MKYKLENIYICKYEFKCTINGYSLTWIISVIPRLTVLALREWSFMAFDNLCKQAQIVFNIVISLSCTYFIYLSISVSLEWIFLLMLTEELKYM